MLLGVSERLSWARLPRSCVVSGERAGRGSRGTAGSPHSRDDRRVGQIVHGIDAILRRLDEDVVVHAILAAVPEIGRGLGAAGKRNEQIASNVSLLNADLAGHGAIDIDVKVGGLGFFEHVDIDDAGKLGGFGLYLQSDLAAFGGGGCAAGDLDVDGGGNAEIQDLRGDVGGSEEEGEIGKLARQLVAHFSM